MTEVRPTPPGMAVFVFVLVAVFLAGACFGAAAALIVLPG